MCGLRCVALVPSLLSLRLLSWNNTKKRTLKSADLSSSRSARLLSHPLIYCQNIHRGTEVSSMLDLLLGNICYCSGQRDSSAVVANLQILYIWLIPQPGWGLTYHEWATHHSNSGFLGQTRAQEKRGLWCESLTHLVIQMKCVHRYINMAVSYTLTTNDRVSVCKTYAQGGDLNA